MEIHQLSQLPVTQSFFCCWCYLRSISDCFSCPSTVSSSAEVWLPQFHPSRPKQGSSALIMSNPCSFLILCLSTLPLYCACMTFHMASRGVPVHRGACPQQAACSSGPLCHLIFQETHFSLSCQKKVNNADVWFIFFSSSSLLPTLPS